MSIRLRLVWVLGSGVILAGCQDGGGGRGSGPGPPGYDTLLVDRLLPERSPSLAWVDSLGIGNGWDLAVLPRTGAVAVLDAADGEVRWMEGGSVVGVGRAGSGPGELRFPTTMAFRGDTVAVLDRRGKVVVFELPGGSLLWQREYSSSALYNSMALLDDGSILIPVAGAPGGVADRLWPDGRIEAWGEELGLHREREYSLHLLRSSGGRVVVVDNDNGLLLVCSVDGGILHRIDLPPGLKRQVQEGLAEMTAKGMAVVGSPYVIGLPSLGDASVFVRLVPIQGNAIGVVVDLDHGGGSEVRPGDLGLEDWDVLRTARALLLQQERLYALGRNEVHEFGLRR